MKKNKKNPLYGSVSANGSVFTVFFEKIRLKDGMFSQGICEMSHTPDIFNEFFIPIVRFDKKPDFDLAEYLMMPEIEEYRDDCFLSLPLVEWLDMLEKKLGIPVEMGYVHTIDNERRLDNEKN